MIETLACARGCTIRAGDDEERRPRPADHGHLCRLCYSRLTGALARAGRLVDWLRENINATQGGGDKVSMTKAPPAPLSLDAVDAADSLHATLVSWALLVAEESSLTPPDLRGTRWGESGPIGIRTGRPTAVVAEWLRQHLDWITIQAWAGEIADEIPATVQTLEHRWPTEAHAYDVQVPCPRCQRLTLRVYPPTGADMPRTVTCLAADCGVVVPEDAYDAHCQEMEVLARQGRMELRTG